MPWLLMTASLVGAWRDMEIEKLPGLGPSESVEAWFERTINNKSVPDIAWWQYQQEVLALCEPFWKLVNRKMRKRLAEYDYWELWQRRMPQFGYFVYVPLPWHHIVEQHGLLLKNYGPLRQTSELFSRLDFERYNHFITLGQASYHQISQYCTRGGFTFQHFEKLALIFTSRLENLDRVALNMSLVRQEVPIPLIRGRRREAMLHGQLTKKPAAFFAGSCTCPMRRKLAPIATAREYDMRQVHPCGKKVTRQLYINSVANSSWVLTPRGSFPATYMMSEAIQAGSLPVYIYGPKDDSPKLLPPVHFVAKHLPFVNIGIDWRDFAVVLTADFIPRLPQILSELNPTPRLCTIRRFRPLFTVEGTFRYILAVLSHYSLSLEKGNRGKERQPR